MTIHTANFWLINNFRKFYLSDNLFLIIGSINKENFIQELSDFVDANKEFAEAEITKNNPNQAEVLIQELTSLNYVTLQKIYSDFYDRSDPLTPVILKRNDDGLRYLGYVNVEYNGLLECATPIFNGSSYAYSEALSDNKSDSLKSINEIRNILAKIENIINGLY